MICTNFPFLRAEYEDCFRPVVEPLPGGDSRAVAPLTLKVRELVESGVQTYSSGAFLPIGGEFFFRCCSYFQEVVSLMSLFCILFCRGIFYAGLAVIPYASEAA